MIIIQDSTAYVNDTIKGHSKKKDSTFFIQSLSGEPISNAHKTEVAQTVLKSHVEDENIHLFDTVRVAVGEVDRSNDKAVFKTHELQNDFVRPVSLEQKNPDWFILTILILLCGIALFKVMYNRAAGQLLKAFMSTGLTNRVVRDENIIVQQASVFMSIIFYLSSALLLYKVSIFQQWNHPLLFDGFGRFIVFAFFISMLYSGKMILLKVVGFIFRQERAISTYIFNVFLLNNILGLLFTPLIMIWIFVPTDFVQFIPKMLLVLICLSLTVRYIRGIAIARSIPGMSLMHIFLYFCALELAPWALLIKFAFA